MVFLDDIVDVGDHGGDQEGKDEGGDVMLVGPDTDQDGIQDGQEREPPGDPVNHDGLCVGGRELVDDGAEEEEVDDGPGEESPDGRGEIRLLDVTVDGVRGSYGVDVGAQEEEVNEDVNDFEKETVPPLSSSHDVDEVWWERGGKRGS